MALQATVPSPKLTIQLEELNEEDQQLKTELEMLVSRLKVMHSANSLGWGLGLKLPMNRNPIPPSIYLPSMPSRTLSKPLHHP